MFFLFILYLSAILNMFSICFIFPISMFNIL